MSVPERYIHMGADSIEVLHARANSKGFTARGWEVMRAQYALEPVFAALIEAVEALHRTSGLHVDRIDWVPVDDVLKILRGES